MKRNNTFSVRAKLVVIGVTTVVVFLFFSLFSFYTLNTLKINGAMYGQIVQGKDLVADILPPPEYVIESYLVVLELLDENNTQAEKARIEKIQALYNEYQNRHQFWLDHLEEGKMKTELVDASYRPAIEFYTLIKEKFIPALQRGDREAARILAYGPIRIQYEQHRQAIDTVVQMATEQNAALESRADQIIRFRSALMISIIVGGIGSLMILIYWTGRSLLGSLLSISRNLQESAEQVSSSAKEITSASQSLAEGATEQAAGLEETSSSLEEMSSMTKQNADNAQQANVLATQARNAANEGAASMERMGNAINDIQKSSDETSKIIKVIDEIAFQTNLLALNAAVEAARAGEAGKGFAVVAEEVRNLAMRSAEAAKNTSSLIEESVKNAKNGVQISTEVSKQLQEIVTNVSKTTDLVAEIAAASQEQAQGIEQVNTAVSQMDKVTQQNAANAEESASASEELSAQAEQMHGIVQNLASLVDGSRFQRQPHETHKTSTHKKAAGLSLTDHTFHHIAEGKSSKTAKKAGKPVEKNPAKVIPLEDEFKEFNS
jgi:methyl-accepting chemotaxis protein